MANSIPSRQWQGLNSDFQNCEILPEFVMLTEDKIEVKNTLQSHDSLGSDGKY